MKERDILDLLHERYGAVRPGTDARRYATAEHVSNTGPGWMHGLGRERIADFVAQDTYFETLGPDGRAEPWTYTSSTPRPRPRQVLHGFEVKVSRSDWLTELRDPSKAEAWKRYCDRWWLVAPRDIVGAELPEDWGLISPTAKGGLRVIRQAPLLDPEPMPAAVRAQLMRSVAKTAVQQFMKKGFTP